MLFSFHHPKPVVSSRPVAEMVQKHRITPVDSHTLIIPAKSKSQIETDADKR